MISLDFPHDDRRSRNGKYYDEKKPGVDHVEEALLNETETLVK